MKSNRLLLEKVKVGNGMVEARVVLAKQESSVHIHKLDTLLYVVATLSKFSSDTVTEIFNSHFLHFNLSRLLVAWSYSHDISRIAEKRCCVHKPKMVAH